MPAAIDLILGNEIYIPKDGLSPWLRNQIVRLAARTQSRRALVTILDEEAVSDTAILSEAALAEDWDRPEEDAAWAHLQPAR